MKKGIFSGIWKKGNIIPALKKEVKALINYYRPISFLLVFGEIFERVIYNSLLNYFLSNKLFIPSQSGFLPGDSCIAQLLPIIHEIQTAFDENPTVDMRGVFLDISKAFGKVWHDGLIFKLKSYGVEGELLLLLKAYLRNREQRVVLNGQTSEWKRIYSGVPQGSALGPLLFSIYINDLPDGITSLCKILADDTPLSSKVLDVNKSVIELNADLKKIKQWAYQRKIQFNPDPYKQANEVIFSRKSISDSLSHSPIKFNERIITKCNNRKHLGIILDLNLNFNTHIDQKIKKCNKLIGLIKTLSVNLLRNGLLTIYKSFIRPHLDYGDILYDKCLHYDELCLHSLAKRCWQSKLLFFYKIVNHLLPDYLYSYLDFYS